MTVIKIIIYVVNNCFICNVLRKLFGIQNFKKVHHYDISTYLVNYALINFNEVLVKITKYEKKKLISFHFYYVPRKKIQI